MPPPPAAITTDAARRYGVSVGAIGWLAEIFPLHMRGLGFGISAFFGWGMNGVLALVMPTLLAWSLGGTFGLLAAVGVLGVLFIYRFVPETRGRTLEALEEDVTTGAINIITVSQKVHAKG